MLCFFYRFDIICIFRLSSNNSIEFFYDTYKNDIEKKIISINYCFKVIKEKEELISALGKNELVIDPVYHKQNDLLNKLSLSIEKNKSQVNELTSFLSEKLVPLKNNILLKYSSYKISEDKKEKEQKQNSLKMFSDEDIQNNLLNLQAYEMSLDSMIDRKWKEDQYFDLKKIYNKLRDSIYSFSQNDQEQVYVCYLKSAVDEVEKKMKKIGYFDRKKYFIFLIDFMNKLRLDYKISSYLKLITLYKESEIKTKHLADEIKKNIHKMTIIKKLCELNKFYDDFVANKNSEYIQIENQKNDLVSSEWYRILSDFQLSQKSNCHSEELSHLDNLIYYIEAQYGDLKNQYDNYKKKYDDITRSLVCCNKEEKDEFQDQFKKKEKLDCWFKEQKEIEEIKKVIDEKKKLFVLLLNKENILDKQTENFLEKKFLDFFPDGFTKINSSYYSIMVHRDRLTSEHLKNLSDQFNSSSFTFFNTIEWLLKNSFINFSDKDSSLKEMFILYYGDGVSENSLHQRLGIDPKKEIKNKKNSIFYFLAKRTRLKEEKNKKEYLFGLVNASFFNLENTHTLDYRLLLKVEKDKQSEIFCQIMKDRYKEWLEASYNLYERSLEEDSSLPPDGFQIVIPKGGLGAFSHYSNHFFNSHDMLIELYNKSLLLALDDLAAEKREKIKKLIFFDYTNGEVPNEQTSYAKKYCDLSLKLKNMGFDSNLYSCGDMKSTVEEREKQKSEGVVFPQKKDPLWDSHFTNTSLGKEMENIFTVLIHPGDDSSLFGNGMYGDASQERILFNYQDRVNTNFYSIYFEMLRLIHGYYLVGSQNIDLVTDFDIYYLFRFLDKKKSLQSCSLRYKENFLLETRLHLIIKNMLSIKSSF